MNKGLFIGPPSCQWNERCLTSAEMQRNLLISKQIISKSRKTALYYLNKCSVNMTKIAGNGFIFAEKLENMIIL